MFSHLKSRTALRAGAAASTVALLLGGGVAFAEGPFAAVNTGAGVSAPAGGLAVASDARAGALLHADTHARGLAVETDVGTDVSASAGVSAGGEGSESDAAAEHRARIAVSGTVTAASDDSLTVQTGADSELTVDIAGAHIRGAASGTVGAGLTTGARVIVNGQCDDDTCTASLVVVLPQPTIDLGIDARSALGVGSGTVTVNGLAGISIH